MISTIPPPRPVSVNSVARAPVSTASTTGQKTVRSTSTEVPLAESLHAPTSHPTPTGSPGYTAPLRTTILPICSSTPKASARAEAQFVNLPIEIHEAILDHLFGERVSALTAKGEGKASAQCWNKALRHPRRKALANLSLLARVWTPLVQSRIYRHIKIKGTTDGLADCAEWFSAHPHLAGYVRHIELWVPIWGQRARRRLPRQLPGRRPDANNLQDTLGALWGQADTFPGNDIHYYCSTENATLEEMFQHVQIFFSAARVLTLEGGHCKNPPMIRHFRHESKDLLRQRLPVLPNIQVFVMRGAWNLIRDWGHWYHLSQALPALREWHCAYAQPRPEAYFTMSQILVRPPASVRHLNLSLDGFYKDKDSHPLYTTRPRFPPICQLLGEVTPNLESLAFTGRLCASFFDALQQNLSSTSLSPLKSLDIVVRACCRNSEPTDPPPAVLSDELSGITNLNFIRAFEKMVLGALQSLKGLPGLDYLRVRFVDLDSTCPLLNPYFQLMRNECSGLWSCQILDALRDSRPSAQFIELKDGIYPQYGPNQQLLGAVYPISRPRSIQVSTYKIIADASKS